MARLGFANKTVLGSAAASFTAPCLFSCIPAVKAPVERGFRPDKSNFNLMPVILFREKDAPVQKNALPDFHPFDL